MRVLFLHDHLRENGGLRVVHDLTRLLQDNSTRATMFVLQGHSGGAVLTPSPDAPVVFGVRRKLALRWAIPAGAWPLIRESRRSDILVSGSEIGFTLLLGWFVAKLVRKPLVILVQSPLDDAIATWVPKVLQPLTRWVNARAAAAICVSSGLIQGVVDNGLPRDRVFGVPVGLDVERIHALAEHPSSVTTPTGRYIIAAGRLERQKGFDVLIRAHATVLRAGLPHALVIVGEGNDRAELEGLADRLNVAGSVKLPGFVENLHPLVANADVFVLSSRQEGMGGLVLLEALAHGTPVIATDCPTGPRELLDDGRLGELIPVDDVDALAAAIRRHFEDPTDLRLRALGGPVRVQDFDPANSAYQFANILHTIAGGRQKKAARNLSASGDRR